MSTDNYAKYISEQIHKEKVRGFKDIAIDEGLKLTSDDYINMLHMYIEDLESHFEDKDLQQIQELSKGTLGRYAHKSVNSAQDSFHKAYDAFDSGHDTAMNKARHEVHKRLVGVQRAAKKLGDKKIERHIDKAIDHHEKSRDAFNNLKDRAAAAHQDKAETHADDAHSRIQKASGVKE